MEKRKRRQVKKACSNCRAAHAACVDERPCTRCVIKGLDSTCTDIAKRKRARRALDDHVFKSNYCNDRDETPIPQEPESALPLPTHVFTNGQNQEQQQRQAHLQQQNYVPTEATPNGTTYPDIEHTQDYLGDNNDALYIHQLFHTLNQKMSTIERLVYLQNELLERVEQSMLTSYNEIVID
mmetsp:Transcript_20678/g.22979  ORF Transcript_20678/g.22979 Transcript_20678/m.22979 type:complete len:181 (+) Transcript_20678:17-559(+)